MPQEKYAIAAQPAKKEPNSKTRAEENGTELREATNADKVHKPPADQVDAPESNVPEPSTSENQETQGQSETSTSETTSRSNDANKNPDNSSGESKARDVIDPNSNQPQKQATEPEHDGQGAEKPDRQEGKPPEPPTIAQEALGHRATSSVATNVGVSEWSHQQLAPHEEVKLKKEEDAGWQAMPAYAEYDIFDDDGKLVAHAHDSDDEAVYAGVGGAGKGYSKVQIDDDAQSATSMDDNTAYLFKEPGTNVDMEDEDARDPLAQMQATKHLLNDNQKIAYVGLVRLAMADMIKTASDLERTRGTRKTLDLVLEALKMWSQKMMVRLYGHIELDQAEQLMIEQLAEHGLQAKDLTPSLMENARVKNPVMDEEMNDEKSSDPSESEAKSEAKSEEKEDSDIKSPSSEAPKLEPRKTDDAYDPPLEPPPPYKEQATLEQDVQLPSDLPNTENIDIDLRWTVLCDLFLILIADSIYDARSRSLLEKVASYLEVSWIDICRFEKRVTDSLEMQEAKEKETWNEDEHIESRRKRAKRRRLMMMGLATVGGGLVIGLSAGVLAPAIGAGLAAGFTAIGVSGTSSFLAGAGGAALVGTTGVLTGSAVGVKAAHRRTGAVQTFEYRPLFNNKRVNLIVTVAGWLNGKEDDVRLPFSTVNSIMGDMYAVYWEPEMLRSMGQTIGVLATEALTQSLQQILGSTLLISLMAALQAPIVLSKLSYLIDNPWSVSLARADRAGLVMADSLIERNLGTRPITLVGFSVGARVVFAALKELSKRGALGLVQNVYLFGSPMVAKKDEYLRARSVVSGRFVSGYATTDWILGYLFRLTSGGIMRVAGLTPVEVDGIENYDLTKYVPGHMAYRKAMPKILKEVGWEIESEEFAEIEDPDPDNHEARQRELINEIEEARKEIQENPGKKGKFSWLTKKKQKLAEKKDWEMYEANAAKEADGSEKKSSNTPDEAKSSDPTEGPLFDVEAIRKEAFKLTVHGMEVKELESTMPMLKVDSSHATPNNASSTSLNSTATSNSNTKTSLWFPRRFARSSKSYDAGPETVAVRQKQYDEKSVKSLDPSDRKSESDAKPPCESSSYNGHGWGDLDENVNMTFGSTFDDSDRAGSTPNLTADSHERPTNSTRSHSAYGSLGHEQTPPPNQTRTGDIGDVRAATGQRNIWADDDDEFAPKDGEVSMSFA